MYSAFASGYKANSSSESPISRKGVSTILFPLTALARLDPRVTRDTVEPALIGVDLSELRSFRVCENNVVSSVAGVEAVANVPSGVCAFFASGELKTRVLFPSIESSDESASAEASLIATDSCGCWFTPAHEFCSRTMVGLPSRVGARLVAPSACTPVSVKIQPDSPSLDAFANCGPLLSMLCMPLCHPLPSRSLK